MIVDVANLHQETGVYWYGGLDWFIHMWQLQQNHKALFITSPRIGLQLQENDLWEDQGEDGRTILEWVLNK